MSDPASPCVPPRQFAGGHHSMDYYNRNIMSSMIIPQQVYPAPQPRKRLPNVEFTMRGILGVRLVDALNPAFNGLDNPDFVPRMSRVSRNIHFRLKWPGYPEWRDIAHVFDHTYNITPNTTRKVAQIVARKVKIFLDQLRNETGAIDGWQLTNFSFDKLVLVELRHISQDSWQPVLAFLT